MPEALVVPLSGETARVNDVVARLVDPAAEVEIVPLGRLAESGRRILHRRRYELIALVGSPPTDEIGYGLSSLLALAGRPRYVVLVDLEHETIASIRLLRYAARSVPFALGQFAASAAALAGQWFGVAAARRPRRSSRSGSRELKKLVYLRPVVGAQPPVGGGVTHSHEVIRALRSEGVEVEAYTTGPAIAQTAASEPEPPCRWHVARMPRSLKAVPASAAVAADAAIIRAASASTRAADAIYQRHARFSLAGALLARLTGKPLFLEYNGSEQFVGRYWTKTPLRRRLAACENAALKAADRIFVVSQVDRRELVERGVEAERIVMNPNGVDARRFARGGGAEVRLNHSIDDRELVIGFLGSFGPWHGGAVLADAFAEVAGQLSNARLLLVGDGVELASTRRVLDDAGLLPRTTLVGQVMPHEVPAYLDACDILASPHVPLPDGVEFFGSPTKLFEYMAAGKAIVASRLGQIAEVLDHGVTGWLVDPGDASSLAEALVLLAASPELRAELGSGARKAALTRHGWELNARRIVDAYAELAGSSRAVNVY